ncbi:MAG: TetR/AcrR family transcriptional regulator [Thermoleophilia bacterium]
MSPPVLSRARAVEIAIAVLDAEGPGAVTMRRVARDMGVPLMSLYRHVRSKDDLDGAVVEALVAGVRPEPRGDGWDPGLRAWAVAYREMVRRHPNAAPLLATRPAAAYRGRADDVETALRALAAEGLSAAEARVQLRAALVAITAFCNAQAAARASAEEAPEAPPDPDHPLLADLMADLRSGSYADEVFDAMVSGVVAGIDRAIADARAPRPATG